MVENGITAEGQQRRRSVGVRLKQGLHLDVRGVVLDVGEYVLHTLEKIYLYVSGDIVQLIINKRGYLYYCSVRFENL